MLWIRQRHEFLECKKLRFGASLFPSFVTFLWAHLKRLLYDMNFFFYWHVQCSTVPQTWICLEVLFRRQWYMSKNSWCARQIWKISLFNPRTYTQIHTPTVVQGRGGGCGVNGTPPDFFDMLQYFKTILPLIESFWSS